MIGKNFTESASRRVCQHALALRLTPEGSEDERKAPFWRAQVLNKPARKGLILLSLVFVLAILYFSFFRCVGTTRYSAQYNEGKFNSLRAGMSVQELERIMGPPLRKIPQTDGDVLWAYSDRPDVTCSYWQRLVYIRDDKIDTVVGGYWEE